jgi:lipoprotein signal peptidase
MKERFSTVMLRLMGFRRGAPRDANSPGRRASDREPLRGWRPALFVGLTIALLDWGTKAAISWSVALGEFREVIPERLAFWHVRNEAMILGLYDNLPIEARKVIAAVAALVAAVVVLQIVGQGHRLPGAQRTYASVFVGVVVGGMLGNLGERVVHWGVTDFISLYWEPYWLPPGNIADIALFLSVPMAVPVIVFELMGRARRGAARSGPAPSDAFVPLPRR